MLKRLIVLTLSFSMIGAVGLLVGCGQKSALYLPAQVETPVETSTVKPEKTEPKASTEQTTTK